MNEQLGSLKAAIAGLEAQRAILGSAMVDAALGPLLTQLAALEKKPPESGQQRKQATVLFADMSGFTAMSETMDAEELAALMNTFWDRIDKVIEANGGRITAHIGDAVMGVWGADQTRENEPQCAVRAALGMQATLARIREEHGHKVAMRIGVNTGPVLLGEMATTKEYTAMGDTVNLASRLEHAAPIGGILISHATYRHLVGVFDCVAQPPLPVKGKKEPIQTYVVLRERKRSFRAPGRGVDGVETRMVGRDREFALLKATVQRSISEGNLQAATLLAEAGVGKSRLLAEFGRWVESSLSPVHVLQGRADPETRNMPHALLRDAICTHFGIESTDSSAEVRRKLDSALREAAAASEDPAPGAPSDDTEDQIESESDDVPDDSQSIEAQNDRLAMQTDLVAYVLGFDVSASPTVQGHLGAKSALRDRGLRYLADMLRAFSRRAPLLILLEDVHWADESSIEALTKMLPALRSDRVTVVCAARPAFFDRFPQWGQDGHAHEVIRLESLSADDSNALVNEILKKAAKIPPALRRTIVKQADGNPFYIEELVNMLIEDRIITTTETIAPWEVRDDRLANVKIPATLTAVLQARLDGLPPDERKVLQRASVIGRVFWDRTVADLDRDPAGGSAGEAELAEVRVRLVRLRAKEMILGHEASAFSEMDELLFKHALMRDATYESVLIRERKQFHERVAAWLIAHSGERRDEIESVIAEHLEKAGQTEAAAASYHQAGNHAFQRSAFIEALASFERARSLLPAGHGNSVALGVRMGETLLRLSNYGRAREVLQESAATARDRGDLAHEAEAYSYLSTLELNVGNKVEAKRCIAQSLVLARELGADEMIAHGSIVLAWAHFRMGEREEAHRCFRESLERFERLQQPKGLARAHSGLAVMADGERDFATARAHREKSLTLYRSIGCRQGVCVVFNDLGEMERLQQNYAAAGRHYEEALKVAREIDDVRSAAIALANLGHTHAALQENTRAAQAYWEGIETAMSAPVIPWALDSLAGLALIMARTGAESRAIAIVRMVAAHPALYGDTKPVLETAFAELRTRVPPAQLESAPQSGNPPSLEEVLAELRANPFPASIPPPGQSAKTQSKTPFIRRDVN